MINELIKNYVSTFSGQSNSYIADMMLLDKVTELSHRTLRGRIGEYKKSLLNKEKYCTRYLTCDNTSCIPKQEFLESEGKIEKVKTIWKKEDTIDYFKNSWDTSSVNQLAPYLGGNLDNVLIIGDTHEPFTREGYMEHCLQMQKKFDCGTVIHIGDEVDNHALSYHESSAEADSVAGEFTKAMSRMKEWYKIFPEVTVIVGNHSSLPFRKANTAGLTKRFLKAYEEIWEAPKGWNWKINHEFLGVYYTHNASAKPLNMAVNRRQSVVGGHHHTLASIEWNVSKKDKIFGMLTGCGIDDSSYAFAYAKDNAKKSIVSCAVVLNGEIPIILPMEL